MSELKESLIGQEDDRVRKSAQWYVQGELGIDRKLIRYRLMTLQPYLKGSRYLELGSGDGETAAILARLAQSLVVVDASPDLLALIPPVPELRTVCSLFETFSPQEKFDTIIADHVLEHVQNPVEILRRARSWLAPGGRLLAGVPNALSLHRRAAVKMGLLSHPAELNDRDRALGHRRIYTTAEFHRDLAAAGWRILYSGGVFLKPLSHAQIEANWSEEMIAAFFELGKEFPELAAEIYAVCE